MIFLRRVFILISCFVLIALCADAQDKPIGYWRSHLPYNVAVAVATDGTNIFTACFQAFFTLKETDAIPNPVPYSKVEGMSDIGMQCVAYDAATSTVVLVYTDGNIDLFKENENTFYNIPDFKIKNISGTKSVSQVYADNGIAYVSTSVGILVIDLTTHNINETYQFINNNQLIAVNSFIRNGGYFYAATTNGLYKANDSSTELQNFQVWQLVDSNNALNCLANANNKLYVSSPSSIYTLVNDTLQYICTQTDTNGKHITHIDSGPSGLLVSEYSDSVYSGVIKIMGADNNFLDSYSLYVYKVQQAVQMKDSTVWYADNFFGLKKAARNGAIVVIPNGPMGPGCFDIYANNKAVWLAHGGYSDDLLEAKPSGGGVSNFTDDHWKSYTPTSYPPFEGINMDEFITLAKDETSGNVYMGSFIGGLFTLHPDGTYELINNSVFDTSNIYFGNNIRQIAGITLDPSENLWVTTISAYHQLYVKDANGWFKFRVPGFLNGGPVVVDDNGQVWWAALKGGGVVVYDPAGTIEDPSDDKYYEFGTGVGSGNLPSNNVFCIAKDKNNNIWVGTDNGIGIISNCNAPGPCDGQIPIVQYDQFAGYLFAGSNVHTIAVDGGNRKWVGTDAGVWLLSSDAQQIIYRFTVDNSPLPSNSIRKISIDKVTGDVYIGTDQGMVSYRSTATEGGTANQNVEIFPNPVESGYSGTIAIKGLVADADVRITDINGHLVYRTKAYGGQAVWNGSDYTGHRPQSGVYLVFVSSSDGSQTYTGKIVFMQ